MALLVGPVLVPLPFGAAAPTDAGFATLPSDVRALLEAWLDPDAAPEALPTDAASLLRLLAGDREADSSLAADGRDGWTRYLDASGLSPTREESALLRQFALSNPALSELLEDLAHEIASARLARDATFAPFSDAERARLASAVARLASGEPLGAEDARLVAAVDLGPLVAAAERLVAAAKRLDAQAPRALGVDAGIRGALPLPLVEAALARDVQRVLREASGGAAPVSTRASYGEALSAVALLHGVALAPRDVRTVPTDLQQPLADLLAALAHRGEGVSGDVVLATLAEVLPSLTRAAHNLSLEPPGTLRSLAGEQRPLQRMRADDLGQVLLALEDALGPWQPPAAASLATGAERLHAAHGASLTDAQRAALRDLEGTLGPRASAALGALLAAQAAYAVDLAPDAPVPRRALAASEAAADLLASGEPLTLDQVELLREHAAALLALRALTAARAGPILEAAEALRLEGQRAYAPGAVGTLYEDDLVVVLGVDANHLSLEDRRVPPVLVLDLGGDDLYTAPVGGVDASDASPSLPASARVARTSVAIDLGGDDLYDMSFNTTLGAARGLPGSPALGLLLDAEGHDVYRAPDAALGFARDGLGVVVDVAGSDRYEVDGAAFAVANASRDVGLAFAALLDGGGHDAYRAKDGFARLHGSPGSESATALFLDLRGNDTYDRPCPTTQDPCFGTPRGDLINPFACVGASGCDTPLNRTSENPRGTLVFIDGAGNDTYPRAIDPAPPSRSAYGFDGRRTFFVQDVVALDGGVGGIPLLPADLNLTPEGIFDPDVVAADSDGDGYPDPVEILLGTNATDPDSRPVGIPAPPAPVPHPSEIVADGNVSLVDGARRNLLLDVPVLGIAVGLPGRTEYRHDYGVLTLDLGLGEPSPGVSVADLLGASGNDVYLFPVARDGHAIDLGGDDLYAPEPQEGVRPRALGSSWSRPAALVDLGGDDRYFAGRESLGYALNGTSQALFLDAAGDDAYGAGNSSQAHALAGQAYFLDLGGNDLHGAPSQGVVGVGGFSGAVAVFVDAEGDDTYDCGRPLAPDRPDTHQGAAWGTVTGRAAAFVDAGGTDAYLLCPGAGATTDVSPRLNNVMRARQADDRRVDVVTLRYDAGAATSNRDGDSAPDPVETVAGTNASSSQDRPVGSVDDASGYLLKLPRLGIAVGATTPTTYDVDYALLVDLGGPDKHLNRAGGTSQVHPVAVAVDVGSAADTYDFTGNYSFRAAAARAFGGASLSATTPEPDLGIGAAQGAGVLGVGVLYDAGGANEFRARSVHGACEPCQMPVTTLGAMQGAGVLGVGVLVALGNGGNVFNASAEAFSITKDGVGLAATARTHAQGAALVGVGVLGVEGHSARDTYVLGATARSTTPREVTTGQGYASRGRGILLDAGGDNVFVAGRLAQAAADDDASADPTGPPTVPVPHSLRNASGSLAALLLPGRGNDAMLAEAQAQAYAGAGGQALLIDMDGDDNRTLLAGPGHSASGQAAARSGGAALLLDNRGNDRYVTRGLHAQGAATQGVAVLADLAGSDLYEAGRIAQGVVEVAIETLVAPSSSAGAPAAAVLFDRTGNDVYALLDPQARGQGSVALPSSVPPGTSPTPANGVAVFIDAGGGDFYVGEAAAQTPAGPAAAGRPSERPQDGNDWEWKVGWSGSAQTQQHVGLGIDTNEPTRVHAFLDEQMQPASRARIEARTEDGPVGDAPVQGTVALTAWLSLADAASPQMARGEAVDRVEFYLDGAFVGEGRPEAGNVYVRDWTTDELDGTGAPRYRDGWHAIEAWIYPRLGTPSGTGYGAAADGEPWRVRRVVAVDNPPLPHGTGIPERHPTNLSVAGDSLVLPLRVDRDLEREDGTCPACALALPVHAGPDEWALALAPDRHGVSQADPCLTDSCRPGLDAESSGGFAYLSWTSPEHDPAGIVGYRVLRGVGGGPVEKIAFVDPRAPLRLRDQPGAAEGASIRYEVHALRFDASGTLRHATASKTILVEGGPPAPTGLRAMGAEGGVLLSWRPEPLAEGYEIHRAEPGRTPVHVGDATGTFFVDEVPLDRARDPVFSYTVKASAGGAVSAPSLPALAAPVPGHRVDLTLEGATNAYRLLDNRSLGGAWTHELALDVPSADAPDGLYFLNTTFLDGAGRRSSPTLQQVALDRLPPQTTSDLAREISGGHLVNGRLRVPFSVRDLGTGAAWTMAFTDKGACAAGCGPVPSSRGFIDVPAPTDGASFQILLLSEDAAGNVEGLVTPYPWRATLLDALRDPQASHAWRAHVVDLKPPSVETEVASRVVAPGALVRFNATAHDGSGTGIVDAFALVGNDRVPLVQVEPGVYEGAWTAHGDGVSQIRGFFVDGAGNQASLVLGVVRVDAHPPRVEGAEVVFAGGRLTGRAGDLATVRVVAVDNGTEDGVLSVTADLSNVSSRGNVTLPWEGTGALYVVRDFPVDRLGPTDARNVTIRVVDLAGNAREHTLAVVVDGRRVAGTTPHLREAGATTALVNWSTETTASARVDYGPSPQLGLRSAVGAPGLNHTVVLEGLVPATTYYARAVSISPSGVETLSDTFSFTTLDGLRVEIVGGAPAFARESLPLDVRVVRHDGVAVSAKVDVLLQGPRGSPRIVSSQAVPAGTTRVEAAVGGLRDGEYLLTLVARAEDMSGATSPANVSLDRVPPALLLRSRGALAVGGALLLEVEEAGSGVDLRNATARIGDVACPLTLENRSLWCRVPELARDAKETGVVVRVPDRAGNVGALEALLGVDADAPRLRNATVSATGTLPSVRPGERALVRVVVDDVTLRNVTADVSSLGGPERLALRPRGDGWQEAAFEVAAGVDGQHAVTITAMDAAARVATATVRVTVDGTAPVASGLQADAEGPTSARVSVRANEPVTVSIRAPGLAGEATAASGAASTHHQIFLVGLAPGDPFRALVTLRDAAGHETTVPVDGRTNPDVVPPGAVRDLVAEDFGDGAVSLRWSPASDDVGVAAYRVLRMDEAGAVVAEETEATSWSGRVDPGATFSFSVVAVDHGGNEGVARVADVSAAAIPHLSDGRVDPPMGGPGLYAFEVRVTLAEPGAPEAWVDVDGVRHALRPNATDCRAGCLYRAMVFVGPETLGGGPHAFSFGARNKDFSASFPEGRPMIGPTILGNAAPPDVSGLAAASPIPTPGAWVLVGVLVAAAAGIAIWKKQGRNSGR